MKNKGEYKIGKVADFTKGKGWFFGQFADDFRHVPDHLCKVAVLAYLAVALEHDAAFAWVANLAVSRGRPMQVGQVVITGSVIPTLPIAADETFRFTLNGIGPTEMRVGF